MRYAVGQFIELQFGNFGTQVARIEAVSADGSLVVRKWRDHSGQFTKSTLALKPGPHKVVTNRDPRVRRARGIFKKRP